MYRNSTTVPSASLPHHVAPRRRLEIPVAYAAVSPSGDEVRIALRSRYSFHTSEQRNAGKEEGRDKSQCGQRHGPWTSESRLSNVPAELVGIDKNDVGVREVGGQKACGRGTLRLGSRFIP